ncbi:MAG: hypothetical protein M3256_08090 [Actinomycetota bacterium]|nr:hypothetical protein [Actinomycetota bacterium]
MLVPLAMPRIRAASVAENPRIKRPAGRRRTERLLNRLGEVGQEPATVTAPAVRLNSAVKPDDPAPNVAVPAAAAPPATTGPCTISVLAVRPTAAPAVVVVAAAGSPGDQVSGEPTDSQGEDHACGGRSTVVAPGTGHDGAEDAATLATLVPIRAGNRRESVPTSRAAPDAAGFGAVK